MNESDTILFYNPFAVGDFHMHDFSVNRFNAILNRSILLLDRPLESGK